MMCSDKCYEIYMCDEDEDERSGDENCIKDTN